MNWKELDDSLGITTHSFVPEPLPGDCIYFKNPEVNPLTPQWQGENTIYHGGDKYYGHGIGLTTAQGIIDALNRHRKSGATQSAYLLNTATRLNFKRLFGIFQNEYSYDVSA
jgi:protein-glutamine gamma-glutamyltransferase